jgi:hypothetical protein
MEWFNGIYDDDGNKFNPDMIKKPGLCLLCKKDETEDPMENILCTMNRFGQRDENEFKCEAFEERSE